MIGLALILMMLQDPPIGAGPPQPGSQPTVAHRIAVPLPEPICPTDLQRFGEFLTLAAPQQMLLTQAHGRYLQRLQRIVNEETPMLDALNAAATMASKQHPHTFLAARASEELYDHQNRMRREMQQADDVLFAELESVLAESQKPEMTRVRNFRQRTACTTRVTWMIRPAQVDLAVMAWALIDDPDVLAGVDSIVRAYESNATPLVAALEREMTDVRIPMLELSAWRLRNEDDEPAPPEDLRERSQRASEKRKQMLAESVRLQRRIADLNDATLAALQEALPPDRAEALQEEYHRRAFGVVYQDQFRVQRACETILESASINEAQRTAVESMWSAYTISYDAINAEMERLYNERCIEFAATLGSKNYEPYRIRMRQLREDRWRLSLGLVRQILGLLPGVETGADLEYLRQAIEQEIKQSANDRYPGA